MTGHDNILAVIGNGKRLALPCLFCHIYLCLCIGLIHPRKAIAEIVRCHLVSGHACRRGIEVEVDSDIAVE